MKKLFFAGILVVSAVMATGCVSVKSITPEQLAPTLSEIKPMPVYFRTPEDRSLDIQHLAYIGKPHPALSKYPFLRVELFSECLETSYNPTGLIVSVATFPLAMASNGGFWKLSPGTTTCKEGSKMETKVKFVVFYSLKSTTNYELICNGEYSHLERCQAVIDAALNNWNKNMQIISVKADKETETIIKGAFGSQYFQTIRR